MHATTWTRLIPMALLVVLLAAGCRAGGESRLQGPDQRMADRLALYERHAGPPVERFRFWDLKRFEVVDEHALVVWTTIDDAYLIRVMRPCVGLEFATGIGLSSTQRYVHQRFDTVQFDDQRCRIESIRPIDGEAFKRAEERR